MMKTIKAAYRFDVVEGEEKGYFTAGKTEFLEVMRQSYIARMKQGLVGISGKKIESVGEIYEIASEGEAVK